MPPEIPPHPSASHEGLPRPSVRWGFPARPRVAPHPHPERSSRTADRRWNNESHRPQVRELEKQLGQTQSRSVGTACDELSVCPDPRKLTAQERNLLRIRTLERDKQEGWEVTPARPGPRLSAGQVGPGEGDRPGKDSETPLRAGDTRGVGSPLCVFLTSCPSSLRLLMGS